MTAPGAPRHGVPGVPPTVGGMNAAHDRVAAASVSPNLTPSQVRFLRELAQRYVRDVDVRHRFDPTMRAHRAEVVDAMGRLDAALGDHLAATS